MFRRFIRKISGKFFRNYGRKEIPNANNINNAFEQASKKDLKKLGNNWSEVTKKLDKFTPNIKRKFLN